MSIGLRGYGYGPTSATDYAPDRRAVTERAEMEKLSDADIKNVRLDGGTSASKSELMPPWSKTLTEEEVDTLVSYIRKLCKCQAKQ